MRRLGWIVAVALLPAGAGANAQGTDGVSRPRLSEAGVAKRLPALAPAPDDGLSRALRAGRLSDATYALERARALFHPEAVGARYGGVRRPDPHAATLVLRDLAVRRAELSGSQRRSAQRLLARPSDGAADPAGQGWASGPGPGESSCQPTFCVHWTTTGEDAPPLTDTLPADIPDWVGTVKSEMQTVWDTEIGALGYRPPKSDATSPNPGIDGRVDIYLAQLGDELIYGYCTTDDPNAMNLEAYGAYDVSAYCVIDNDFAEFPAPGDALRVTLAHEFHHAVQFAYDVLEDLWLLESAATAMEDRVYDDINDNLQYLAESALTVPRIPLDYAGWGGRYGQWIWLRFLQERFAPNGDTLLRRVFEFCDGAHGAPDHYSTRGIASAIAELGGAFRFAFAEFGAVNVAPRTFYEEGATYPVPPLARRHTLRNGRLAIPQRKATLHHLSTFLIGFRPGPGMGRGDRLAVKLDLPPLRRGSEATLVVLRKDGTVRHLPVALDRRGDGLRRAPFNRRVVRRVVLVLTNASRRFTSCYSAGTDVSCAGIPRDDRLKFAYRARAG